MSGSDILIDPTPLFAFEDTIDGYFPLQASLQQMMGRLGVAKAVIVLRHAPIMRIPGLSNAAPVPLRIEKGQIGQIDEMVLYVQCLKSAVGLAGWGRWQWFGAAAAEEDVFDPNTRLAEPAYVTGLSFDALPKGDVFGQRTSRAQCVRVAQKMTLKQVQEASHAARLLGPFSEGGQIARCQERYVDPKDWVIALP